MWGLPLELSSKLIPFNMYLHFRCRWPPTRISVVGQRRAMSADGSVIHWPCMVWNVRVADAIASLAPSFQKLFQLSFLLAVNLKSDNKPTQGNASSVIDDAGMGENVGQTLMRLVTASEKRKQTRRAKIAFPLDTLSRLCWAFLFIFRVQFLTRFVFAWL
mgnify:CR=1 FL=1